MRFPVVYGAFLAVGFASEFLRGLTYRLMEESQEKLAEAAIRDELTGLHNRRWFNERISEEYDKRELRADGVFVLCDIDNFKSINDTYGHTNGDGALIHIAQQLQNNIRGSDLLCRWGGEEFLLFLSDCAADHAFETCDRLRQAVEQSVFVTEEGSELSVTISMGAVVLKKGEVLDSGRVFSLIDEYLYLAKDNGKNRVEMGTSLTSPTK